MKNSALRFIFGTLLLGISLQLQTLAITVTNLNDNGPGSLRQAIADVPTGGTIDFAVTGTIVLTNGQLVITNDLTVSGPGATNLIVIQSGNSRILMVTNGSVTISGMTIANGKALGGAGYGNMGGGIINFAALTLRNCTVSSNLAASDGGGLANLGTLMLSNSIVSSNSTALWGGGIANYGAMLFVVGSTISGNVQELNEALAGSGIHGGNLIISNSTVSSNRKGCGISCWGGSVTIVNCTVASNAVYGLLHETSDTNSVVTIQNSIFTGNGGETWSDCAGWIVSKNYNFIQSNFTNCVTPLYCTTEARITGETNQNIYGQDPKLGPLADNGGPTPTHALGFDSPAIDAGHSGGATTDQRGLPRGIDDPSIPNVEGSDGSDIGAYEADPILKVTDIGAAGAEIRVGFNSVLGRNYRLESEGNLDNSWTTVSNNIAGTGSAVQMVNAGATNQPRQFFRIVLP